MSVPVVRRPEVDFRFRLQFLSTLLLQHDPSLNLKLTDSAREVGIYLLSVCCARSLL